MACGAYEESAAELKYFQTHVEKMIDRRRELSRPRRDRAFSIPQLRQGLACIGAVSS
jgi:hypothetical protein